MRQLTPTDRLLQQLDLGLRAVFARQRGSNRADPAVGHGDIDMNEAARQHAAALMRVNHAGEVAAQGLYNGQALFARDAVIRERMAESAAEETDHLAWCKQRVEELGANTSLLGPLWYAGSFSIGALAGLAGDRWSLGFVKETEDQVVAHLQGHLQELPSGDLRSRAIVETMIEDETHHGNAAMDLGGAPLPGPVRQAMRLTAGIMTRLAYRI